MVSLLSSLSGTLSSSAVLSTIMPAAVFVVLFRVFVIPVFLNEFQLLSADRLASLEGVGEILGILLFTLVLSGLLTALNTPLIRLFEGYPWQHTWLGRWRTMHFRRLYDRLESERLGLPILLTKLEQANLSSERREKLSAAVRRRRGEVVRRLNLEFPKRESILPTKLGNIIRSFESYPQWQYQMAAITLYSRLISKIDARYADMIAQSKASFDFMINASFLSFALALCLFLGGFVRSAALSSLPLFLWWFFTLGIFLSLGWWLYQQSSGRAQSWGELVKGAFDLYRNDLLVQLGYEQKVRDPAMERRLWRGISQRLIYGDPPRGSGLQLPAYAWGAAYVEEPSGGEIALLRGVSAPLPNGNLPITIRLSNTSDTIVKKIVLIDTLSEDYVFVYGSVQQQSMKPLDVSGANPLRFTLEAVPPKSVCTFTYEVRAL